MEKHWLETLSTTNDEKESKMEQKKTRKNAIDMKIGVENTKPHVENLKCV